MTSEHRATVFELIDLFNEESEAACEAGRSPVLPGDVGPLNGPAVTAATSPKARPAWFGSPPAEIRRLLDHLTSAADVHPALPCCHGPIYSAWSTAHGHFA